MENKKVIITGAVVLAAIVGVAGYALGYARGGTAVSAAYAPKIAALNALFPSAPTSVDSLSGEVESIQGNVISLNAEPITRNPFVDTDFPLEREVTVATATSITRVQERDLADISLSASSSPALISPVTTSSISLGDIAVGETVIVTADGNILNAPSFTATLIEDQAGPVAAQ